jgi:hypothetical protein
MGTKFFSGLGRILALAMLAGVAFGATAAPDELEPLARIGVVDARTPGRDVTVVKDLGARDHSLKLVRLSDADRPQLECCVQLNASDQRETSILRYDGEEASPAPGLGATLTTPFDTGFVGLVFSGADVRVQRLSAQRLLISWPRRGGLVHVDQCLSSEGLHLRMRDVTHPRRTRHFYIDLGMAVEPNC